MTKMYKLYFMKAVALCFKTWLKPDEAMIYCNLNRTQLLNKCRSFGIHKNNSGYFNRQELDRMLSGDYVSITQRWDDLFNSGKDDNIKKDR